MDSSWMENLHSVLDSSKKLCLESGESIPLGKRTNLIFETDNLHHVSPRTVRYHCLLYVEIKFIITWIFRSTFQISRCSIISFKSSLIKWEYLISSWLNTLPSAISEQHKDHINSMALRFCRPLFYFIDNFCDKVCKGAITCAISLPQSEPYELVFWYRF